MSQPIYLLIVSLLMAMGNTSSLYAQDSAEESSIHPLFAEVAPLKVTLSADFKALMKDRGEDPDYHPAHIMYLDEEGNEVETDEIKIKVRGNFRRKNCRFPPIRLNFDKDEIPNTIFDGQNKLKMVTPCETKRDIFEQYLLQEYLIYRMYNLLTDNSFQVRLLEVTYLDSAEKYDPIERYAFLIEDEDKLADRLNFNPAEARVHPKACQTDETGMMALFQFMIGNTDWSIPNLHNVKLMLSKKPGERPLAIPYDFDWSGFINAPYAQPNPMLGTRTVRERVFRGFCRSEAEWEQSFARMLAAKEAILSLVRDFEPLSDKVREESLEYLQDFFRIIEAPDLREEYIIDACRTDQ